MKTSAGSRALASTLLVGAMVTSGCATSAGGREAAAVLSASVTMVADEGRRFTESRDQLARARLHNIQTLNSSLFDLESANDLELHAWEVVGARFRRDLYAAVLAATDEAEASRQEREALRARQERELRQRESAVRVRSKDLAEVAASLAALAEEPSPEARRAELLAFSTGVLQDLQLDARLGLDRSETAQGLVSILEGEIFRRTLSGKERPGEPEPR